MKRVAITLVAGLLIPDIALAQDMELARAGAWTILPFASSCRAVNRDPYEFNFSPYNALVLQQKAGSDSVILAAHFWPDAFAPPAEIIVRLIISNETKISVVANATQSYQMETVEPLSPDQLDTMAEAEFVTVSAPGLGGAVTFNMKDLSAALVALAECAKAL